MADSCIVCLGDLKSSGAATPHTDDDSGGSSSSATLRSTSSLKGAAPSDTHHAPLVEDDTVARLLPCGHYLHHECLKPWVERANSCPICRVNFNVVELSAFLGAPTSSSYAVEDKQQVAEIDPTLVIDDDIYDAGWDPCIVCEDYGDESTLMSCDGCDASCHAFCAGLDEVPQGPWFCQTCLDEQPRRLTEMAPAPSARRTHRTRANAQQGGSSVAWARIWRQVQNRIHLDLDFPFDDDDHQSAATTTRTDAHRRELDEWNRRLNIAERQGGGRRFREAAAALEHQRPHPRPEPNPESQDELRAWNAFEKAKEVGDNARGSRKRKSTPTSPADPAPEPERKLKRPRLRRAAEPAAEQGEPSSEVARMPTSTIRRPSPRRPTIPADASAPGPSFLQSLLNEVEGAPSSGLNGSGLRDSTMQHQSDRAYSPRNSSPEASPSGSNHATPRGMTPPPLSLARPSSPLLSSTISPIYPRVGDFAPFSPAEDPRGDAQDEAAHHEPSELERARSRKLRPSTHGNNASPPSSPPRSKDASPTRGPSSSSLSYSTKSEIQRMVKTALKPLYQKKEVDKDEYTDVCRDVSRKLYEKVGEVGSGALADAREREKWQRTANGEVESAVKDLKGKGVATEEAGSPMKE
ncbi:hypothetical protein BDY21DRAFT_305402 [Lineolata rhizophorae]|uniref:PHD and RING finger domain protein n=1 Tax=Lineolata rhizophorae TaxID=578093 RepID=A0A6A6NYN1_9PEZI|nr:hypothetical protein BDY21DRAFT_305402 [Lineolata rhizophorae]